MLEKTLESPLDCKEIQPVHSEGDQPWDFFGQNDAKADYSISAELIILLDSSAVFSTSHYPSFLPSYLPPGLQSLLPSLLVLFLAPDFFWSFSVSSGLLTHRTAETLVPVQFSSVQFSRSVVSDSLQPHESQNARPPSPSPTPRVHSNSHLSSR